jgi:hypothetical protein
VLGGAARLIDFDEPIKDEKKVNASIAALEKRSAARKRLHHTEGKDALNLIWRQPRESLRAPSIGSDGSNASLAEKDRDDHFFKIVIVDAVFDECS